MAMTQVIAQTHLDAWLEADLAVAQGQSYTIGDRSLTRANAPFIREQIAYWTRVVNDFTRIASGSTNSQTLACWNDCT
jgi:hypothetical protein